MMRHGWIFVVLLALALSACAQGAEPQPPSPAATAAQTTPAPIAPVFANFYQSLPDPAYVLGPALSTPVNVQGRTVQFFRNMVLEADAQGNVRPWPLGRQFRTPGKPYEPAEKVLTGCDTIGEYRVCYPFLEIYTEFGGQAVFGNPLAPVETNGLQIFQDFENVRMVYAADHPRQVTFAPLGQQALEQSQLPVTALPPAFAPSERPPRLQLSLQKAEVFPGETLEFTLVLVDGNFQPVPGQEIVVILRDDQGNVLAQAKVGPTSQRGLARFRWQVPQAYTGNELFFEASTTYQGFPVSVRRLIRVLQP